MEIWKDIPGFSGYKISSYGSVVSPKGKKINHYIKDGYPCVGILGRSKKVHRLMWAAFVENISSDQHLNHIDSNRKNFSISNLERSSPKHNAVHAMVHGKRRIYGEKYALNEQDVRLIRFFAVRGNCRELAKIFNVGPGVIVSIKNYRTYKFYEQTEEERQFMIRHIRFRKNKTNGQRV